MALTPTSIVGASNSGGVVTKTVAGNQWGFSGAVSSETVSGDLLFAFDWQFNVPGMIGIGTDATCQDFATIDYGINLQASRQIGRYENGLNVVGGTTIASGTDTGVLLEIVRMGTEVLFYYTPYVGSAPAPGQYANRFGVISATPSTGTIRAAAALFFNGQSIDFNAMTLTGSFTPPPTFARVTSMGLQVAMERASVPGMARVTSMGLQAAMLRPVPGAARVTSMGLQVAYLRTSARRRSRAYVIN